MQCHCEGLERCFNTQRVDRELADYRHHGAVPTTRRLIATLQAEDIAGMTLLDIGGGLGAIPQALLPAGVREAVDVDASAAYLTAARTEAERLGVADRMRFVHGNFVAVAETVAVADIVTVDRVICCFADMPALVSASAARAGHFYGIVVVPRDTWWMRLLGWARNVTFALTRNSMRFYVHATAAIDTLVRAQGLEQQSVQVVGRWQVILYMRNPSLTGNQTMPQIHL
jgi:predicted TPR repeat methyltransferase